MRRLTLLLCAAAFVTVLDANAVAIALPSIRADLGFSRSGLQWVVGAYSLAFGGAMLVAGRAADVHGRRRLLVTGLALFYVASLAGALAPTAPVLIAARALQGLGAALAFPASLALIAAVTEPGEARTRALGLYGAVASAAFLAGTVAGGLLTEALGWRSVLLPGAAVAAVAAAATRRLAPDASGHGESRLGLPGAAAATAGVLTLLSGVGLAARDAAGAGAALAAAALLFRIAIHAERRSPDPLLPRVLLRRPEARLAVTGAFLTVGTGVGTVFVLTIHMQEALGYDPFAAGLALTLLGVGGVSAGLVTPRIARRAGLTRTLAGALAVQAGGVALLTRIDGGLEFVALGTATMGFGHFAATVAFTALATGGDRGDDHGIAMGVVGSAQQLGGAVGLALIVAVATETRDPAWPLGCAAGLSALGAVLVLSGAPARPPRRGWRTTRPRAPSSRR